MKLNEIIKELNEKLALNVKYNNEETNRNLNIIISSSIKILNTEKKEKFLKKLIKPENASISKYLRENILLTA